jgi:hypothetical protein
MDYEPLLNGIARFIGVAGRDAEESAGKVAGTVSHTPTDVERWLGNSLSAPEKQVPLIHDYLRGTAALQRAGQGELSHVDGVSVPAWESLQGDLEAKVQADPEVQKALKDLYVNSKTPPDPDVTSTIMKPKPPSSKDFGSAPAMAPIVAPTQSVRRPSDPANFGRAISTEVPADTPMVPQAKAARGMPKLDAVAERQKNDAWNEFAIATESQDPVRIQSSLERIKALHDPEVQATPPNQTPSFQKALNYMSSLEEQVQQWKAAGVTNDAWTRSLEKFHEQADIDGVPLPKAARNTVERFEAWADAQKPPTPWDRVTEALGVPRAVMSSTDVSAPGRQGILMLGRPEYWQHMGTMFDAFDDAKYHESQAYIRNHPDYEMAQSGGLALTDLHNKLAPREEAFASRMAENLPLGAGTVVRKSEQAYTTFLNRLRFDVFSNTLREAAAAGVDVKDQKFLDDLAEFVNTSTGRGGAKGTNISALSTILFSPRLALARLQTLNPGYYMGLHPYVRAQALKTNLSAASAIVTLIGLAAAGGAKVTWDFRSTEAGKIRIGNTRVDLGGGIFQFVRLFTQFATNETMNADTGQVTKLGSKYGVPTRLDKLTQFLISKEAPVASFVTDWMRGKDQGGNKFNLTSALVQRMFPLAMQDMYDVLKDKGIEGLFYSIPASFGVGLQTYKTTPHVENVPFLGVKGQVPMEQSAAYAQMIQEADKRAATAAAERTMNLGPVAAKTVLRAYIKSERLKARIAWIKQNQEAYRQAKLSGQSTVPLVAPGGSQ